MQSRPASASHQHSWGQLPNGRNDCSQAQPLGGLNPSSPWQQTPTAQWDVQSSQPGLPGMDLRAIMQEEQQAAVQGRARLTHHAGNNSRHDSANSFLTSTDAAMHYPGLGQQAQPHLSQQQMPQQQMPQQQQRSGGFYMRNKRDESVPVKQNWAQVTPRDVAVCVPCLMALVTVTTSVLSCTRYPLVVSHACFYHKRVFILVKVSSARCSHFISHSAC